ncbi:alpha/beta fold hydrolase [Streptomyces chromofuscus]|uniref:alpha/beta fold hydrolase n=1 Tax=Streptomyces chromofuscus TaxID=42881 RepID=UPI0019C1E001|nr:alpha/beta hydrolase [Streptomyces chromofuscus]GGT35067.1 hypothetical protein GCM10010254_64350 [Streptomyces chromofuscus]
MLTLHVEGAEFTVRDERAGEPVLLVAGSGAPDRVWDVHQVPALLSAGFRVVTFDRTAARTLGRPEDPRRVAAELAVAMERLELAPCRVVGASFGAEVVQELLLTWPDLVSRAVLMAARGRSDLFAGEMADAERELEASGVRLPPRYAAWLRAVLNLSPATWRREEEVLDWLDLFEAVERTGAAGTPTPSGEEPDDRLPALGRVTVPVL